MTSPADAPPEAHPQAEPVPVRTAPARRAVSAGLAAGAAALLATPAAATEPKKGEGVEVDPLAVEINQIVVPVAQDGRLVNYIFFTLRVILADSRSADQVRTQQFLVRDAMVRAVSRAPAQPGPRRATYVAAPLVQTFATAVTTAIRGVRVTRVEVREAAFMRP